MEIIRTVSTLQEIIAVNKKSGKSVGFVPTMGFLHKGHISLIKRSHQENQITLLSIYVNPTQFNNPTDYQNYPIDLESDLELAKKNQVDYVFIPEKEALYPDQYAYQMQEVNQSLLLEGEYRPGHFTGMLTIVLKLLNIVQPDKLYLGEKDYQQYSLIQGMVKALFLQIEVIPCETIREADGLAMSSRNVRLTPEERARAPMIYNSLLTSQSAQEAKDFLENNGFKVEYVTDLANRRYVAAWLGKTRLIDNISRT